MQAVPVQGAGQAGQATSPRVTYPMSHSFVAPGGTRWDVSGLWALGDRFMCLRTALVLKHEHRFMGALVLACVPFAFIGSSNGCISYIFHDMPISKAKAPRKIDPSTDPSKQLFQSFRSAFNSFFRSQVHKASPACPPVCLRVCLPVCLACPCPCECHRL